MQDARLININPHLYLALLPSALETRYCGIYIISAEPAPTPEVVLECLTEDDTNYAKDTWTEGRLSGLWINNEDHADSADGCRSTCKSKGADWFSWRSLNFPKVEKRKTCLCKDKSLHDCTKFNATGYISGETTCSGKAKAQNPFVVWYQTQ